MTRLQAEKGQVWLGYITRIPAGFTDYFYGFQGAETGYFRAAKRPSSGRNAAY